MWPWRSTVLITAFVFIGSNFAAHQQEGRRADLDAFARVLLFVGSALLLWRQRHPVAVVFGTAAAAMVYLGAGYPYGPVFLTVAVACFSAVVAGHRFKEIVLAVGLQRLAILLGFDTGFSKIPVEQWRDQFVGVDRPVGRRSDDPLFAF